MQRIVAFVSFFICSSVSGVPSQCARIKPPFSISTLNSSYVSTVRVHASRIASALAWRLLWISSSSCFTYSTIPSMLRVSFVRVSRRITSIVPFSMSRAPSTRRTGTPLSSYSANLKPGRLLSASSNFTEIPSFFSSAIIGSTLPLMAVICSSFLQIGTITTWIGARAGGNTRPLSSEWVMMRAPIRRVETPHDVAHTYSMLLFLSTNCTLNALAKF